MRSPGDRGEMKPFAGLTSFQRAREAAEELAVEVSATQTLALAAAASRVLATAAEARVDVPSADRAAMDGYAIRSAESAPGRNLRCAGRLAAGQSASVLGPPGTCIEIATGAPIPEGADAVVPVEATRRQGDQVQLAETVGSGDNISRRGEDLRRGLPVARPGDLLTPALLAACAAGGVAEVEVWRRPRVLIAPTGDEVVPLGTPLEPGQVYDSNALGLIALATAAGAEAVHAGIVADEPDALVEIVGRPGFDLVVTVGGTSVGRRDLVSDTLHRRGEVLVHGVDVRPGKPLLLGRVRGRGVVGLPGFPATCMMLGYALLDPMVRRMGRRATSRPRLNCRLAEAIRSPRGKFHLMPVAVAGTTATPTFTFSSSVSSMAGASGWIEVTAEVTEVAAGAEVTVLLF